LIDVLNSPSPPFPIDDKRIGGTDLTCREVIVIAHHKNPILFMLQTCPDALSYVYRDMR
jgi:hypothetical protein